MATMLELRDLEVRYGGIRALKGISLEVAEGSIVALIGANGAGKTTTLQAISGLQRPRQGEIVFEGQAIHHLAPEAIVALRIAHVPEGRRIFPELSVEENLKVGAYLMRDKARIGANMARMFGLFPRLRERRRQIGATLSGGEQQMLAFARALMMEPKLLLMDEPSLGLAPQLVEEITRQIQTFKAQGMTLLLVEQNAVMALSLADRGYVMETGRITIVGTGAALLADARVREAYLGAAAGRVVGPSL